MPTAADFVTASCLATLFTPEAQLSPSMVLTRLLPGWMTRFDADPVVMSLPGELPPEIPRVVLQSKSGEWKCEIASARINVHWARTSALLNQAGPSDEQIYAEASGLLENYRAAMETRVGRIAAVVTRFAYQEAPARFLAAHFCREELLRGPLNRPESFELHAHKTYRLADEFEVNSWFRNKTGSLTTEERNQPVVLVEQDVNTLLEGEAPRVFTHEEIARFFERVIEGFRETLGLYYPA